MHRYQSWLGWAVLAIVTSLYGARTWTRNPAWQNNCALWGADYHHRPSGVSMNDYAFWCILGAKVNPATPGSSPPQLRDVSVEQLLEAGSLFIKSASITIDSANRFENLDVVTGELARRKEFGKARDIVDKTVATMDEYWPKGIPPLYFDRHYPNSKKVNPTRHQISFPLLIACCRPGPPI
jgi:hypothetical protein